MEDFMASSHSHDGHRDRIKKKFLESGFNSFEEHEILEMLLFYSIPRKNTNEIAHNLINKFGNIYKVCNADVELLQEVDGISYNSAILLKMIPSLCKEYTKNIDMDFNFNDINTILKFCINQYTGETTEILKAIYLDNVSNLIACVDICSMNSRNSVIVNATKIIERAEKYKSSKIILIHNHPNGSIVPSQEDIISTNKLIKIFRELRLNILDHIIVANDKAISMVNNGYVIE